MKPKVKRYIELANQLVEWKKEGKYNIVGVDLAGPEDGNPVTDFAPAFEIIHRHNKAMMAAGTPEKRIGITLHSGETQKGGCQSIENSINIGARPETPFRIGHGLQLVYSSPILKQAFAAYLKDPSSWEETFPKEQILQASPLLKKVIDQKITLEMCPKSNVQTRGVAWYTFHPAVFLHKLGVQVTLNADNRTISNSDITNEMVKLYKYRPDVTYDDLEKMMRNAFESSFVFDPSLRKEILDEVDQKFQAIRRNPDNVESLYRMNHPRKLSPPPMKLLFLSLYAHLNKMVYDIKTSLKSWYRDHIRPFFVEESPKPTT